MLNPTVGIMSSTKCPDCSSAQIPDRPGHTQITFARVLLPALCSPTNVISISCFQNMVFRYPSMSFHLDLTLPHRAAILAAIPAVSLPVLCVDTCLLYTSDAADEEDSVDLGGRRIIKKKKNSIVLAVYYNKT
eukprot:TRINITY_DN3219_c0_g2_i1.p1 TRINITY_DN3219_c0_g2~~TRINITY_DN3219_c0_g2_i1.p1  ORF type:complete len:133 (-),score=8.91 TRINITY_DN3219_c0_g2_i1:19-417(-)